MKIPGWRGYYSGCETLDSTEAQPSELPDGMVGVVEFLEPPYRKLVHGGDWLYREGGRWHATSSRWGVWVDRPEVEVAVRGQALSDAEWSEIHDAMLEDRRWP